jgi:hypothetical protein
VRSRWMCYVGIGRTKLTDLCGMAVPQSGTVYTLHGLAGHGLTVWWLQPRQRCRGRRRTAPWGVAGSMELAPTVGGPYGGWPLVLCLEEVLLSTPCDTACAHVLFKPKCCLSAGVLRGFVMS